MSEITTARAAREQAETFDEGWTPDVLGDDYQQRTLPLGPDPDGEGEVFATVIRYRPAGQSHSSDATDPDTPAVLFVHGYSDYFFQEHIAEHFADRGYPFYALDLRKCGRSIRQGQTPHYITNLARYDAELDQALAIVRAETGRDVLIVAHSTGGLVTSLWLNRRAKAARAGGKRVGVVGAVLDSPWFDLQGPAYYRTVLTPVVKQAGRLRGFYALPGTVSCTYGDSIYQGRSGEWDYNLDWKPLSGFPARIGWLRAIRNGHAELQAGLAIGIPALVLRSTKTRFARQYSPENADADNVLDVKQIQRWAGCLGDRTNIVPIEGARHDVFLSHKAARTKAFEEMDSWLDWLARYRASGA